MTSTIGLTQLHKQTAETLDEHNSRLGTVDSSIHNLEQSRDDINNRLTQLHKQTAETLDETQQ